MNIGGGTIALALDSVSNVYRACSGDDIYLITDERIQQLSLKLTTAIRFRLYTALEKAVGHFP